MHHNRRGQDFQISIYQWLFLVPLNDGRDYITPQKAIYKWYISGMNFLPIGGWTMPPFSHLLGEPFQQPLNLHLLFLLGFRVTFFWTNKYPTQK